MRIVISCKCGQRFATDSRFAGRQVNCFTCGQLMTIQAGRESRFAAPLPPVPPPTPIQHGGQAAAIRVRCACGWAFTAPATQQGRSVPCPGCGGLTEVPYHDPLGVGFATQDLQPLDTLQPFWSHNSTPRWITTAAIIACGSAALLPIAILVAMSIYNALRPTHQPKPASAPPTQIAAPQESDTSASEAGRPSHTARR
jgi:hypothetical protein